jgi:DNA-binding transcriptional ArsR family regulator
MHSLDSAFAALADPTRRAILARLALGERTVMELAEPFEMSQPAVSRHLKVLESTAPNALAVWRRRRSPRSTSG